jgi:protein TonB
VPSLFEPPAPAGDGRRRSAALQASLLLHAALLAAAALLPLLLPTSLPRTPEPLPGLLVFFDPPPPPPLPLPRGPGLGDRTARPRRSETAPRDDPAPTERVPPIETPLAPEPPSAGPEAVPQGGTPTGSDLGVPEGMEGGVAGGEIGGVPGGVLGGVLGGTGAGPVPERDVDRGPRPLRLTRPDYPQEAFVKKIEGTVVIEIVIDARGHVVHARVVRSVPLLDQAALECVRQWLFEPAIKAGRPVASLATAPVHFRIL